MLGNIPKSSSCYRLVHDAAKFSGTMSASLKKQQKSSKLAISWGVCVSSQDGFNTANQSMKLYGRSFIPIKFFSSLGDLFKNIFSSQCKPASDRQKNISRDISIVKDCSDFANASSSLFALCDEISVNKLKSYPSMSANIRNFSNVTSLITGVSSMALNCISIKGGQQGFVNASERKKSKIMQDIAGEKIKLFNNFIFFSSSIVSIITRYVFISSSCIISNALQTIPFLISVKKDLEFKEA